MFSGIVVEPRVLIEALYIKWFDLYASWWPFLGRAACFPPKVIIQVHNILSSGIFTRLSLSDLTMGSFFYTRVETMRRFFFLVELIGLYCIVAFIVHRCVWSCRQAFYVPIPVSCIYHLSRTIVLG